MATKDTVDNKKSFNWLRREARGPTYISFSAFSDRPACSFDFGNNGCAASCNYGGELLHMSARDDEKGVVFAHGDFERTYYSSLARAQRQHGGQAAFGLGIATNQKPFQNADNPEDRGSNLKLGQMMERGCFNYRWPFNEYALLLNEGDDSDPKEAGTCTRVSFIKDDVLYQVLRLEKGCRLEADICHYVHWRGQVVLSVGGSIKFGALSMDVPYTELEYGILDSGCLTVMGSTNELDIRVRQLNGDSYDTLHLNLPGDEDAGVASHYAGPYDAYAQLPDTRNVKFRDQQVTFVAEFRLRQSGTQPRWPETPTSEEIYEYLGINPYSKMATGVMWETIFLQREEKSNYFSQLSEVNLIGRCVEKILTVDLVPTTIREQGCIKFEEESPLALVSNLFVQPSIDLESMFWKVRFLTKAYRFLSSFIYLHSPDASPKPSSDESSEELDNTMTPNAPMVEPHHYEAKSAWNQIEVIKSTVNFQMDRLRDGIERILAYLIRTFVQPNTETNLPPLASKAFQSNYYYVMMTIWYVVKRCERFGFTWKWVDGMKMWPVEDCLLVHCLPSDNLLPEDKEKEKVMFLKWYHYASILNLSTRKKRGLLPKAWQAKNLDMKVNLLERDARRAAAAKLSAHQPYSAEDEILDRLGFLAEPMNAEFSKHRAGSVASLTVRRIIDRDFTRYLNPGRLPNGEKGPTSGPWEVHALCYHSQLLVQNHRYNKDSESSREQKAEDAEKYRRKISQFLNAEASVIPCWERTNIGSFQSEATSVLASTLLSICQKDFFLAMGNPDLTESVLQHDSNSARQSWVSPDSPHPVARKHDFKPKKQKKAYIMDELLMRLDAMQSSETARPPAIEWTRYRPPRQYHHESFFNSLEDTPELFESYQADGRVRAHLFSLPDIHGPPAPGLESDVLNVNHMLGEGRVSIIDLKASMPGQWNSHTWQGYKHESSTLSALSVIKKKLSDSLVDQEVQHRMIILSAASSTNTLNDLRLFWRAFHIDSRDCFVNHDTKFPDFSCQKGNTWNTRITLRSWSKSMNKRRQGKAEDSLPLNATNRNLEPTGGIVYERDDLRHDRLKEEDAPIEIPQSLKNSLRFINQDAFNHENDTPSVVELKVSSIVLSTNDFGDFSQCTIISELLEGKSKEVGDQCKELWERFIHQPQTARCLVFLTILGLLCQQMAIEYRNSMDYFIQFIHAFEIEKSFTFDENNLLKGTHGIMQLKLGLWSLESLFKLHNSLVTSMRCIEEASTELRAQIDYGPGRRGERLERMCQHSLGDFERKLTQLVVLSDELNQKIKLNSRYKDSLSTVLSLEDSRNSIRQNSTIQKLTYLTIGYLPLGLITAIFAIPSEQNVIIPSMGLGGFVVSIIGLFIITFTIAVFIEPIQGVLGKLKIPRPSLGGGGGSSSWVPEMRRYINSSSSESEDLEQGKPG